MPATDRKVPTAPHRLAEELVAVTEALHSSIDAWTGGAEGAARPPRSMVQQGLYQQRIYRTLARDDALYEDSVPLMPRDLRGEARANTDAAAKLLSLVVPISEPSSFRTAKPPPTGALLDHYRDAERRFEVDWELLAAVHFVESKFSRVQSDSTAGAQGPMQFIPSTWEAYGLGGDVHDDRDAIMGAANYLHASGSPGNDRNALFAYNHSDAYVDAVLHYSNQIRDDPDDFYAYYCWQVFVLTTNGDVRLTGPGL